MKWLGKSLPWLAVAAIVVIALPVEAQELRGRITGVVTDNTGAVLPGVSITAASPALIQPQSTVTGADGAYHFPALPSGAYTVTFTMSGFQAVKREGIRLTLNTTLTVNQGLDVASVAEELTVTADSPVVDVKNTAVGTAFTKELLTDIPNARDLWAAMAQAPGFVMEGYDVGGSHTGTQTTYRTYGISGNNKTLLEGVNVTEGRDANAGYFDYGSFEEFQLGGSGNLGEHSGAGALLNFTVKSGGDAFHGDAYVDFLNDSMVGDNTPDAFKEGGSGMLDGGFTPPPNSQTGSNLTTKQYDVNLGVGGPIIKGKLWFWAGWRINNQFRQVLGADDLEAQSKLTNKTIKLTYAINSRNNIIAFYNQREKQQPFRDIGPATAVESTWFQASKNTPMKFEWTSVLSDTLFLDLQVAHWKNDFPLFPQATRSTDLDGVEPGRVELTTGQRSGSRSYYHQRITTKPQVSGSLAWFKEGWGGTHNFKFGGEWFRERRDFLRFAPPGQVFYRDRNGAPSEIDIWNTPNNGINDNKSLAFYVNDNWSINRKLTINLALRYDNYKLGWPSQSLAPENAEFFDATSTPDTQISTLNSLGPKVGFAYDLTGEGRTVIKGFWGRFFLNPSTSQGEAENPVGAAARRFEFLDPNGNGIYDGPDELGDQLSTLGGAGFVRVDRGIEPAYGDELSVHIEHELVSSLSVRASYVHKTIRKMWDEVDVGRVGSYTVPFAFEDCGADNTCGTGDDQTINLFDRPPGVASDRVYTNPGRVDGVPDNSGDYDTFEVALNRRFKDRWLLLTSFAYTKGNDFRDRTTSNSATQSLHHNQDFEWRPNERRFGAVDWSSYFFKVVGRYELPMGVATAVSYKLQSGNNFARNISVRLPVGGSEVILAEPLDANRAPNVGILDFRLEYGVNLGGSGARVQFLADLFNVTNDNVVVNARSRSGSAYKRVNALLDPRTFRIGARFSF